MFRIVTFPPDFGPESDWHPLCFRMGMKWNVVSLGRIASVLLLPYIPAAPLAQPTHSSVPVEKSVFSNPLCAQSSVGIPVASGRRVSPLFTRKEIRKRSREWKLVRLEVPRWRLYRTDHFVIRSDALLDDLRALGVCLEEFRAILVRKLGGDEEGVRFSLHLFRGAAAFENYARVRGSTGEGAFYDSGYAEIVAVVPEKNGWISFLGNVMHEFTHHYLDRVFPEDVPPWLEEGLADYFGSLSLERGRVEMGKDLVQYRIVLAGVLGTPDWVPLENFVGWSGTDYFSGASIVLHAEAWSYVRFLFRKKGAVRNLLEGGDPLCWEREWMKVLRERVP